MAVTLESINIFKDFSLGTMGLYLLIFFIAIVVVGLVGLLIFVVLSKRKYDKTIPLLKKVGSATIRIGIYKAKDYMIGKAGDKLWYVKKVKKYLPPATIQTAPKEYTHFEREDGEWINVGFPDIDEKMKLANVKYVQQDMRSNRVAINTLLDQRFTQKSWWEKYGHLITYVIFYFIVAVAMVIIFYQWGVILDKTATLLDRILALESCKQATSGVVPAIFLLLWRSKKRK